MKQRQKKRKKENNGSITAGSGNLQNNCLFFF